MNDGSTLQVAALATYAYFGFCLIGRQFLDPSRKYKHYEVDFVIPIFTIVQFLFFVGWFKVSLPVLTILWNNIVAYLIVVIIKRKCGLFSQEAWMQGTQMSCD